MYTLLLDSSNICLNVGLCSSEKMISKVSYEAWQQQSEYMVPEIKKIIEENNISFKDIDAVVVAIGPGSYTGVRISLAIAKTLAVALNAKLYPVSSLAVLQDPNKTSICLMNARSNRSYFGVYKNFVIIEVDQIKTNEEVLDYINNHKDYSICGDTKYLSIDSVTTDLLDNMFRLLPHLKEIDNPLGLKPVYLKD